MGARISMTTLALAALAWSTQPAAQTPQEKLVITAFAVNMSNIATGANAVVQIRVNSWSTDEERQHLVTTMIEKGEDSLLRELQKAQVHGRWSIPGFMGPDVHQLRLGHDIRYARQTPQPDGGRRIVLATDGTSASSRRAISRAASTTRSR